ncbi:MAG TPA: ubiquitin carboxyl-terminal hydrolase family protein, partial [Vicinamibacterales bacterium]
VGFRFLATTTRVLDHAHAVPAVGEFSEAELAGGSVVLISRDPMNILSLPVPKGEKTFAQAFAEAQTARVDAESIRYAYAGAPWSTRVLEERTSFEQFPAHVLIRLNRISAGMVNGVFRRMKDGTPVVMPDTLQERHLLAFICHHGTSANGGHYTAYVLIGAQWYWLDDLRVTPVADVDDARNNGFLYYYGPEPAAAAEPDSDDDLGLVPMDHSSGESQNEDAHEHEVTMGDVSASPSQSQDTDDEDKPIEDLCPFLEEIFGWDPGEDSILGKGAALSDPKPVDAGRLQTVRDLLTGMIGVRNVETYVVMFRAAPERGKVDDAILAERHRNIGHYVYKAQLRSTDASGQELGYQDPAVWINGRCPFYFELDVWKRDGGKSVRLPVLALHAPYGMPAAFMSKTTPKPKSKGVGEPPPLPSKHAPIDFDGDDDNPLKMRADAMSNLLQIGIPSYSADPIQAMAQFGDGLIAGDFNLDMCQCGSNPIIGAPYQAMANANFIATVNAVPTTLLPVEQKLPADANDDADEEGAWYGHAYDNIFVRSSELAVATTRMAVGTLPPGTRIGGAVDVFDIIERYAAANPFFMPIAETVVRNAANYHKTRHTPATRARHEHARWTNTTNNRQRAYFLYKRYISDHLPVFVDLDIHSKGSLPKSAAVADSSAPKVPRSVIGIRNLGNTCYLNAALQLLWAFGDTALWSATSQQVNVDLYAHVTTFIAVMTHDAETGSYVGDGTQFAKENDTRLCETDQLTHDIRGQLNRSGLH